jgi:hypothetical protein
VKSLAIVIGILLTATIGSAQGDKVAVFVKGAGQSGGFTDPSKTRQDSLKDLQKKVKDSHELRLVDSEADATIVLEVLDRETKRENTLLFGRQNKSSLTVKLSAGEFSTEFSGESGSTGLMTGYGKAAGKIVDQVDSWVKNNREALSAVKK